MKYPPIKIGDKFGRLTVIKEGTKKGYWLCRCVCGNEKEIIAHSLKAGSTRSCGCLRQESMIRNAKVRIKYNTYEILPDKIKAKTPKGEVFYVSKESEWVFHLDCCWWVSKSKYVYTVFKRQTKNTLLHRLLLKDELSKIENKGKFCDHIDGNRANNCLSNLRIVNSTQNNLNVKRREYYGIFKTNKSHINPYEVILGQYNKIYYIGNFPTKEKALKARIAWEKENRETQYLRKK